MAGGWLGAPDRPTDRAPTCHPTHLHSFSMLFTLFYLVENMCVLNVRNASPAPHHAQGTQAPRATRTAVFFSIGRERFSNPKPDAPQHENSSSLAFSFPFPRQIRYALLLFFTPIFNHKKNVSKEFVN